MNRASGILGLRILAVAALALATSGCMSDRTVYRNINTVPEKPDPLTPEEERPIIEQSLEADRARNSAAGAALEKEAAEQPPPPEAPPAAANATGANSKVTKP